MTQAEMAIQGFHARIPLAPHQMTARQTAVRDMIVLCHLGVPNVRADDWRLDIDGMVERPLRLSYQDLRSRPQTSVTAIHQCAGSPLKPEMPTRRITNVTWSGVRLSEILAECGMSERAAFAWAFGADHGTFHDVTVDAYLKDLPLSRINDDVLIALDLNGAPLPQENGFPARLVVPGFYGTNSVKWLRRLTLADQRAQSPFTTRWYNDPVLAPDGSATRETRPVWSIAPEAVIVAPAPDARLAAGRTTTIWGWAWGDKPVAAVELSWDEGQSWAPARLEPRSDRAWQRFELEWLAKAGVTRLYARARAADGTLQPLDGTRNAAHVVSVQVT